MTEIITLQYPNNASGQQQKVQALRQYLAKGWTVVSETVTPGHFKGGNACCLTVSGFACCGLFGAPLGLIAGRTDGIITVTLQRDKNDLIEKRAKIRADIIEAENSQDWESMKELCESFLSFNPDDKIIEKKLDQACRQNLAIPLRQKAKDAHESGNLRAAELYFAQCLEIIPDDKEIKESRDQTLVKIEQLKNGMKKQLLFFLYQEKPEDALSSAENIPYWLQQEKEVAEVLKAARLYNNAKTAYNLGNFRDMEQYFAQYLEIIPQDKKAQESRNQILMEIGRLKSETKTHLISFLEQEQIEEALSYVEYIPYWLRSEKDVSDILTALEFLQKAKEARYTKNLRMMVQYLDQYLEILPNDKKAQELQKKTITKIEELKVDTINNFMAYLAQMRPDEVISSTEHILYWLRQEKEVADIIEGSYNLIEANNAMKKGKWTLAIKKMKQCMNFPNCAWVNEWINYSEKNLKDVRRAVKMFFIIFSSIVVPIGLIAIFLAHIYMSPALFSVGIILLFGGVVLFPQQFFIPILIKSSLKIGDFKSFLPLDGVKRNSLYNSNKT